MTMWRRVLEPDDIDALRVVADGRDMPALCALCKDVPDPYVFVERGYDSPNPFREHLVGRGYLKRCPVSGSAYWKDSSYEYLAGGSEDEYTFARATPDNASKILTEWAAEAPPGGKAQA